MENLEQSGNVYYELGFDTTPSQLNPSQYKFRDLRRPTSKPDWDPNVRPNEEAVPLDLTRSSAVADHAFRDVTHMPWEKDWRTALKSCLESLGIDNTQTANISEYSFRALSLAKGQPDWKVTSEAFLKSLGPDTTVTAPISEHQFRVLEKISGLPEWNVGTIATALKELGPDTVGAAYGVHQHKFRELENGPTCLTTTGKLQPLGIDTTVTNSRHTFRDADGKTWFSTAGELQPLGIDTTLAQGKHAFRNLEGKTWMTNKGVLQPLGVDTTPSRIHQHKFRDTDTNGAMRMDTSTLLVPLAHDTTTTAGISKHHFRDLLPLPNGHDWHLNNHFSILKPLSVDATRAGVHISEHEFWSLKGGPSKSWMSTRSSSKKQLLLDTTPTQRCLGFRNLRLPENKKDFVVPTRTQLRRISLDTTPMEFSRHMFRDTSNKLPHISASGFTARPPPKWVQHSKMVRSRAGLPPLPGRSLRLLGRTKTKAETDGSQATTGSSML